MASGIVLCTMVSAPLMFVTAKMAFVKDMGNSSSYLEEFADVAQVFNFASVRRLCMQYVAISSLFFFFWG